MYCIFTKLSQIVCFINTNIFICWHARCNYKLREVLWFFGDFNVSYVIQFILHQALTGKKQLKFSESSNFNMLFWLVIASLLTFRPDEAHSLVRTNFGYFLIEASNIKCIFSTTRGRLLQYSFFWIFQGKRRRCRNWRAGRSCKFRLTSSLC